MKAGTTTDLAGWQAAAARALAGRADSPQLEARLLLSHVLEKPHPWLITHPGLLLSIEQSERLERLLAARLGGEPLPYLLGRWPFFGRDFIVSPAVLIPRPETELLVETALGWLRAHPGRRRAADIGTGSGCIAASLALEIPDLQVEAADISPSALEIAAANFVSLRVEERVRGQVSDLLSDLPGPYDLVCANLPYIPSENLAGLAVAAHEPRLALDGGADGLRLVERLLGQLPGRLLPGGLALLEIEAGQGQSAQRLAEKILPGWPVCVLPDLAGRPRLLRIDSPAD